MTKNKIALISLGVLFLPVLVFAQGVPTNAPINAISSISSLIQYIENLMWVVFGGIAVICFVVAGILFLTSGGQAEKVQTARSAFLWGIAGVIVGIIAYSIVAIIYSAVGA